MGWGDGNCSSLGPAATVGCRRRSRFVWFRRADEIKGGGFRTSPAKSCPFCPPLSTLVGGRSTETTGYLFPLRLQIGQNALLQSRLRLTCPVLRQRGIKFAVERVIAPTLLLFTAKNVIVVSHVAHPSL